MTPQGSSSGQLDFSFEEAPARRVWPVRALAVEQVLPARRAQIRRCVGRGRDLQLPPQAFRPRLLQSQGRRGATPVVLFRRQGHAFALSGPEDGLHVLVRGRVGVYEQRGQLQLVAETLELVGAGSLQLAFEQLKERPQVRGTLRRRAQTRFAGVPPHRGNRNLACGRGHSRLSQPRWPPPLGPQRLALSGFCPGGIRARRDRRRPRTSQQHPASST